MTHIMPNLHAQGCEALLTRELVTSKSAHKFVHKLLCSQTQLINSVHKLAHKAAHELTHEAAHDNQENCLYLRTYT